MLEYLDVPHDVDVRATKTPLREAKDEKPIHEDDSDADQAQVNALFAAANDLPADDPLRQSQQTSSQPAQQVVAQSASSTGMAAGKSETGSTGSETTSNQPDTAASTPPEKTSNYVTVSDGKKFSVPTLVGLPIRSVIEMTAAAGLQVQISGRGTVREQAPAPGTQVPTGTKIIVRCGR